MNILIDGQTLMSPEVNRGIGVYFKNTLNRMVSLSYAHTWYIATGDRKSLSALDPWVATRLIPVEDPVFSPGTDYARTAAFTDALEKIVRDKNIDVFWCPNPLMVNVLFIEKSLPCKMFSTLHDIIPVIMPVKEWSKPVKNEYNRRIEYLKGSDMNLLCDSNATRQDFLNHIINRDGLYVTLLAADHTKFYIERKESRKSERAMIVFTGGFDYRKNLYGALKAFARAGRKHKENKLINNAKLYIVCNATEEQKQSFYREAASLGVGDRVHLTGFISDQELSELYSTCDVFFFPSLYEGFGLPIVEAMLAGAYILSADNSSLPEVCGEYAMLCNAKDTENMADQLVKALEASRQESIADKQQRQKHALCFSWEKTASETLALFEKRNEKTPRRKIAMLTPWPEQKTGIANFVYQLMPYLNKHFDIDLFVDNTVISNEKMLPYTQGKLYTIDCYDALQKNYDTAIYQLGNNSEFHTEIYRKLKRYGGIAELHDFIVHPFFYHSFMLKGDELAYKEALADGYGRKGIEYFKEIRDHKTYPNNEKYPMSHSIANISDEIIVHNHWSAEQLDHACVIPHASFDRKLISEEKKEQLIKKLRTRFQIKNETVIGCFGFVNENKRPTVILNAVKELRAEGRPVKLIFWGKSNYEPLEKLIRNNGLSDCAALSGYLDKDNYEAALELTDIVVNLRYPSMGEASGTLCESFQYGKPVILSAVNQYLEYPDDVCWKVPVDREEEHTLTEMLKTLLDSPDTRRTLGENAREYALHVLSPASVAAMYVDVVEAAIQKHGKPPVVTDQPIALVTPWYGDDIRGGAEAECNYLAHGLQKAGQAVEVLTTCVKDAASDRGKNTMKPGVFTESGIKVRRFRVREDRDLKSYIESNLRIYHNDHFTPRDEEIYFREDINSEEMYRYIRENRDRYRAFVFLPYMYGITFNGSSCCPEKSILIPCLHDESYAYMTILKEKMNSFRGMAFLSAPEGELAQRLYGLSHVKRAVLGAGMDTDWHLTCDESRFRKKFNIHTDFILYAGRKDAGKKADELVEYFLRYKRESGNTALKLVLLGGGTLPVEIPPEFQSEVIDLGFVSAEDKQDAFAACTLFCNPSWFESFSIVIMEAWLARRPVLASGHCAVTSDFARRTNGGLWYTDYPEFRECVNYLLSHKAVGDAMGDNGFRYVMDHFTHQRIAENYLTFLEECGL